MPPHPPVALVSPDPYVCAHVGDVLAAAGFRPLPFAAAIGLHEVLRAVPPAAIVFDLPPDPYPPSWRWLPLVVLLEDPSLRQVPVILCLDADADRAARLRALPRPAAAVLPHPCAPATLLARLADLLPRTHRPATLAD